MNLAELLHVRGNRPAAVLVNSVRQIWRVQPGDATVYTVRVVDSNQYAGMALGHVGDDDAYTTYGGVLVVRDDYCIWTATRFGRLAPRTDDTALYTHQVLEYFCRLALGDTTAVEPKGLAQRRVFKEEHHG